MSVRVLLFVLAALRDVHALCTMCQARRSRVNDSNTPAYPPTNASNQRIFPRVTHIPVVDSLIPGAQPNESVTPTNHKQLAAAAAAATALAFVGLCAVIAMIFFLVRYFMRRAAIKRRRQASWILRSGQWNMEPKRSNAHETRTGFSDTSSSFSAYPYRLSEHF